jgi:hypothetical protein
MKPKELIDITLRNEEDKRIHVRVSADYKVLWISDSERTIIRICGIKDFQFEDDNFPGE